MVFFARFGQACILSHMVTPFAVVLDVLLGYFFIFRQEERSKDQHLKRRAMG